MTKIPLADAGSGSRIRPTARTNDVGTYSKERRKTALRRGYRMTGGLKGQTYTSFEYVLAGYIPIDLSIEPGGWSVEMQ
jgi:hypothetical protein